MIGYCGQEYSDTFYACASFYMKEELIPYKSMGRLFHALGTDEVVGILVPYENGKDGIIFDGLSRMQILNYHVEREIILTNKLQIVSSQNQIQKVKTLYLTQNDMNDCYLKVNKLGIGNKKFVDTRVEALQMASKDLEGAALVSELIPLSDLNILTYDVRDLDHNTFRYFLITKQLKHTGFHNRILLSIIPNENKKGVLYDILHEIVMNNVNIVNIFINPKTANEELRINLILAGNLEDAEIINMLSILKVKLKHLSIDGSFYTK
jgi:prephenate dehydratase